MKRLMVSALVLGSLMVSIPMFAHHGNAAFDASKKLTLKGTVTEWFWANPHCILEFDVKDENNQVVHWATETSNPADMVNRGWGKLTMKPGDQVAVTFEPAKNGSKVGRVIDIVLPSGQKMSGGFGSLEGPAQGGPSTGAAGGSKPGDYPKQ